VDALCAPHGSNKEVYMTFRIRVREGIVTCRSTQWGDFEIVEYPPDAQDFVEWLKDTYSWEYTEGVPYYCIWDRIVPEDKPQLIPHIIHGIALVGRAANKLWELIKDFPLSELDLRALHLAAARPGWDTGHIRAWLGGIQFPPRAELIASLLETPRYAGVVVARASINEVHAATRITREVAEAILRMLPHACWNAQEWLQLIESSGHIDLLAQYEKDTRLHPFIQEFYARDAAKAWDIFNNSEDKSARAVALNTIVRAQHPNAVDAVRDALVDPSTVVQEAAFDNLDILPREEYAKWLVHFAYHSLPGDYGETSKRAWYKIQNIISEQELAEFLAQKLR